MRRLFFVLLVPAFLGSTPEGNGQEKPKLKMYRIWVTPQLAPADWILYQVNDTSLVAANSRNQENYLTGLSGIQFQELGFEDLNEIKLRRNGRVGGWLILGFMGGFLVGLTQGIIEGDSEKGCFFGPCPSPDVTTGFEKGLGYGTTYGVLGGLAGAITGSIKISIPINRSREKFDLNKPKLEEYSFVAEP